MGVHWGLKVKKRKEKKRGNPKRLGKLVKLPKERKLKKLKKLKKTWKNKFKTTQTSPKTTVPSCRIVTPTLSSPLQDIGRPLHLFYAIFLFCFCYYCQPFPKLPLLFYFLFLFIISTPFLVFDILDIPDLPFYFFPFIEIPPKARTFKPGGIRETDLVQLLNIEWPFLGTIIDLGEYPPSSRYPLVMRFIS